MLANDIRNYRMMDDYIAHHGILGQKWGDKNGPPYPLESGDHSSAEKKAASAAGVKVGKDSGKGDINNVKNKPKQNPLEKMKTDKQRKQALEKAREAKAKKAEEKAAAEAHEAERQKALDSGDYNQIQKYANESSYEELNRAMNKANAMQTLNQKVIDSKPVEPTLMDQIDKAADMVGKATNAATKGIGAWNKFAEVYNTFVDPDSMLPEIGKNWSEEKEKRIKAKQKEAEEAQEKIRKEKIEAITKRADPDEILKNRKLFTNNELSSAFARVSNENKLKNERETRSMASENAIKEAQDKAKQQLETNRKAKVEALTRKADINEIYKNRAMFTNEELKNAQTRYNTTNEIANAVKALENVKTQTKTAETKVASKPISSYDNYNFPDDDNGSMSRAKDVTNSVFNYLSTNSKYNAPPKWQTMYQTSIYDYD